MIQALLIDLDGVIRLWDPQLDWAIEQECGLSPGALRQAAFAPDLLTAAITGQHRDEEWRRLVVQLLCTTCPAPAAEKAVQWWSRSFGAINAPVLELVRLCRQRVKVVLVTNATSRLAADLQQLGLLQEFDFIINSAEVGYAKPQPEIFRAALAQVGGSATAALFVDDSAGNVTAAKQLGITGHHYQTVAALEADLRRYHLLPVETNEP